MAYPFSFPEVVSVIQAHGYWFVFLLMLAEGPIVTLAAAFAASFGIFSIYLIFVLSFFGNFLGDVAFHLLGRFGRNSFINSYLNKNRLKGKTLKKIEKLLEDNYFKAMLVIKLVPSIPIPGLIFTGITKMDFRKFLLASITINILYCLSFTLFGYYFGVFLGRHLSEVRNLEMFIGVIIILIVGALFYKKYAPQIYKMSGKD